MPAKFKPSERVYAKNARGVRMSTQPRSRSFKHYYLKNTSQQELLDAINSDRTKPKHKAKFRNELVRRGDPTSIQGDQQFSYLREGL